jgi:hypothetical protein
MAKMAFMAIVRARLELVLESGVIDFAGLACHGSGFKTYSIDYSLKRALHCASGRDVPKRAENLLPPFIVSPQRTRPVFDGPCGGLGDQAGFWKVLAG